MLDLSTKKEKQSKMMHIMSSAINRLRYIAWWIWNRPSYLELGRHAIITKPLLVTPRFIRLKEGATISFHARLQGVSWYEGAAFSPEIVFDEGSSAQQNLHLTCANRIYIGKDTALAANVTITDINHPYEDITLPIEKQPIQVSPVHIGSGCKVYNNAVILPGTTIGDHCVVGANSVVSGHYESFSIIVGAPAKVVRKYEPSSASWVRLGQSYSIKKTR